jgi:MYXO-CTERM domain-containing protein
MPRRLLGLAVLAVALALAGPAAAHVGAPPASPPVLAVFGPEALHADAPATPGPWLLVAAAAAALAAALRRRRTLVMVLLALLVVGGFETGLHSAHHLDRDAAKCAVAAAASQAGGLTVDVVAIDRPLDGVASATPSGPLAVVSPRSLPPDLGRAPPAA